MIISIRLIREFVRFFNHLDSDQNLNERRTDWLLSSLFDIEEAPVLGDVEAQGAEDRHVAPTDLTKRHQNLESDTRCK